MFSFLFSKKEVYFPTLLGWSCLGCLTTLIFVFFFYSIYGFLAYHQPIKAEVLVVEGWAQDYAFTTAVHEFKDGNYAYVLTVGGPLQKGSQLSPYKTMAEFCADILKKNGIPEDKIIALPHPAVKMNRTFASAIEVNEWFSKNNKLLSLNLISVGAHSRRSYVLFRKALPKTINIGVISIRDKRYDPNKWWDSSFGIRTILTEGIAYIHSLKWI